MKGNNLDRRVQKTRKLLSDALIALITEKGYNAVTIQEIIDRANVGRSTFYAHFENKEQLLLAGYISLDIDIISKEKHEDLPDINFIGLFEHIAEQRELALAMIGKKSGELGIRHLREIISKKILDYIEEQSIIDSTMKTIMAEAATSALISLMVSWMEEGMLLPAKEIAEKAQHLLMKILS